LGAALAIDLALHKPVAGLIIENPFMTAFRTVTQIPLLVFDKFDNLSKIKKVKCPLLVIHAKKDHVIPFWHGRRLYHEANAPKDFFWVEGAGHNDVVSTAGDAYWHVIDTFVARIHRR
jgi:abhydrolase domain-containing protein 17